MDAGSGWCRSLRFIRENIALRLLSHEEHDQVHLPVFQLNLNGWPIYPYGLGGVNRLVLVLPHLPLV